MLYSSLYNDGYLYITLHTEQVYQDFDFYGEEDYLINSSLGFFTTELKVDTLERLRKNIELIDIDKIKNIIIDCDKINESKNSNSEFDLIIRFIIENEISLSLIRVGMKLYEDLKLIKYKQAYSDNIKENNTKQYTNFFINESEFDTINFDSIIFDIYQKQLKEKLKKEYLIENKKKISNSSNVYLDYYINIKLFIEQKELTYFGLYLLCKNALNENLIPKLNQRNSPRKTILFFQSLNGSYLASILSKIALIDMAYIDHVGPINKIYRTILKNNFEYPNNYLIMSDVICMGTEEKIVRSLIEYENSHIIGNLCIVKIEPIKRTDNKQKTSSLFTLTKETNIEIGYKIHTDFE